jgi:hypothetical protein
MQRINRAELFVWCLNTSMAEAAQGGIAVRHWGARRRRRGRGPAARHPSRATRTRPAGAHRRRVSWSTAAPAVSGWRCLLDGRHWGGLPRGGGARQRDRGGLAGPPRPGRCGGGGHQGGGWPGLDAAAGVCDPHEHLLEAAKNTALVPVGQARSIAEFADAVRRAAEAAAEGQWVQTSIAWHESNLAEGRLPTRPELDAASPDHPVLARRGGHLAVASSTACWKARPSTRCWGTCRRPPRRRWSRGCGRRRAPTPRWASEPSGRR